MHYDYNFQYTIPNSTKKVLKKYNFHKNNKLIKIANYGNIDNGITLITCNVFVINVY